MAFQSPLRWTSPARTDSSRGVLMYATLAKYCLAGKQHFATQSLHALEMTQKTTNEVLAANLKAAMAARGMTQAALAKTSGIAQTTISIYLRPEDRKPSASGKEPSAKVAEVERLADALGVECWQLLKPQDSSELAMAIEIQDVIKKHRTKDGPSEALEPRQANGKR